ncbi:pseudouridine synthase family protein [Perilla frutescens var. frutescens]|nr:pseudouridine synthase family protein [Perilla frutescens var. frutescens]
MAAIAAAATALSTLHISRTYLVLPRRHLRTVITSSLSSATNEFNVAFAPAKPKPQSQKPSPPDSGSPDSETGDQILIPWVSRGDSGNLTKSKPAVPTAEPKYSKAARRFYNERFREPPQRLAKVLAAAGVASRRSSEELIFQGKVTVNGSVCNTPQTRVDPGKDIIYVNGNRLPKKLPPKVYFALNKPKGYICSAGEKETKSVISLFDDFVKSWSKRNPGIPKPRLFTVGRLDVATTGLIIVTNDGEFANKVSHPSSNLTKEYIATINGGVSKRHLLTISEGTFIEGVHCTPDLVELLPNQPDISRPRIRIVVHEGRNHEVRELVKNAGLQIHALKRVRIGGFRLSSDLALGKHAELSAANLRALGLTS